MPKVHLEGMGAMGAMIANALAADGISFTWHDTDPGDETRLSWKASTGAILPFGDAPSMDNLAAWTRRLEDPEDAFGAFMSAYMQKTTFCYNSDNPPHGGRKFGVAPKAELYGRDKQRVVISNAHGWNMDVQSMVEDTRHHFADGRKQGPPRNALVVRTHGFGDNIFKWSWGWSGIVRVRFSRDFLRHPAMDRRPPLMYMRQGYQLPYLYKVGHGRGRDKDLYYCGTTLITQSRPKSLDVQSKYETWARNLEAAAGHVIDDYTLVPGTLMEAWRPMADPQDDLIARTTEGIIVRPQYGNGLRMFPGTYDALMDVLTLELHRGRR
jgi:hypothetical protein